MNEYKDAGVNIDNGNKFIEKIKQITHQNINSGIISGIGGFSGLYSINMNKYHNPILATSTDGVGTKLKVAFLMEKHDTIGIDLVAMCVNDIIIQGAKPLFFLDYLSMGKLVLETAISVIEGIVTGCKLAGCVLIGGETAEMPGLYRENEYDLAGFVVGVVDKEKIVDGSNINVGDKLIGIASSGLHSNGYSLVRKICFDKLKLRVSDNIDILGRTLGEELLEPTKIYSDVINYLLSNFPIKGIAHITGGGIIGNLPRILPPSCTAVIQEDSWQVPPVFTFLQEQGNISVHEMKNVFNNGIGLILATPENSVQDILESIAYMDEKAYVIGNIVERKTKTQVLWE